MKLVTNNILKNLFKLSAIQAEDNPMLLVCHTIILKL